MAKWLKGLESLVGGGPGGPKRVNTLRLLLIVGCIGAALMVLNSFLNVKEVLPTDQQANPTPQDEAAWGGEPEVSDFEALEHPIESRLKGILEKIAGVGTVDVLVTIDSTEEIVLLEGIKETNSITDEVDKNGGKRYITSKTREGNFVIYEVAGNKQPYITKKINPRIRGILIVANGAENGTVRKIMMDAVEKGVNVGASRISIVPRKQ
ncbi:stage III sporulation protein AG [Paenibacillus sp. GCM10023252]|uniref:stage III sporulation protein AG n=1 Tax=Paenibacillus sp. GCM10023252 TaxID=3252649 RepID=UPI003617ACFA